MAPRWSRRGPLASDPGQHEEAQRKATANYSSNFLFWDVVFGTRDRDTSRPGPEDIDVVDDTLPSEWWHQLMAPFRA